mgnify:CR=1 FL=1
MAILSNTALANPSRGYDLEQSLRFDHDSSARLTKTFASRGDAQKNTILADAYGLDEDFFDFLRTMQACRDTFGDTEMSMVIAPGQVCEKFFGEININD